MPEVLRGLLDRRQRLRARARCRPRSPPGPARGSRPGAARCRRAAALAAAAAGSTTAARRRAPERPRRAARRTRQQAVGLVELGLVAAAVLLGGALDVGDPLAELVRVGDRLARDEPLALDRLGLVEEPLDLQLGLLGVAGVGALVPDPDAHLEEADGVGVAEVEVLHARLDERGHQRQLRRQAALLRLAGHPGGDLLARGAVAGVGVGRRGGDGGGVDRGAGRDGCGGRGGGRVGAGRGGDRRGGGGAFGGSTAFRNAMRVAARALLAVGLGGLRGDGLEERLRLALAAPRAAARRRRRRARDRGGGRDRRAGDGGGAGDRRGLAGRGDVGGRLPVRRDLLLEADVEVVLVGGVGEVAGAGDRERRADLVRADVRVRACESSLATSRASGLPGPTVSPSIAAMSTPRPKWWLETEPPAVNFEWSEHMHETVILCSWLSLVSTPTTRGSMRPALMSATPTVSSTTFLLLSSASASGLGRAAGAGALAAELRRVDRLRVRCGAAGGAAAPGAARPRRRAPARRRCPRRG